MINIEKNNNEPNNLEVIMCENVYDYYNGALSPQDVKSFERHLIQCPNCERTVFKLDRILNLLQDEEATAAALPDLLPVKKEIIPRRAERKTKP